MIITKHENVRPFDVDGCLIADYTEFLGQKSVNVYDAVTKKFIKVRVNESMVRLLKEEHHRGGYVIVWSRSGYEWATNVIKALDLVPYVDQVLSKPIVYFDDTPVKKWLKDRVFIGPDTNYKK